MWTSVTSVCAGCGVLVEWVLGAVEAGGPCRPSMCVFARTLVWFKCIMETSTLQIQLVNLRLAKC